MEDQHGSSGELTSPTAHVWTVEEVAAAHTSLATRCAATASDEQAPASEAAANGPLRLVSGRYRGAAGQFELELRVDVDGVRPTLKVSGDVFRAAGATQSYYTSFLVSVPVVTATPQAVTLRGEGQFSAPGSQFRLVTVTIPRTSQIQPAPAAEVVFADTAGAVGERYSCRFISPHFRSVQMEQDAVEGTSPFLHYDTNAMPSGGAGRTLSIVQAYAEAGIEVQPAGSGSVIDISGAGTDALWSNAELHASMLEQFSLWRNEPQWKVWLLVAGAHERPDLRGIMFDQDGLQRQGCAVFYDKIKGEDSSSQRGALRTYVHELGHCFNLLHSWEKSFAVPPQPSRADALSWMNYASNYPGGEAAYWAAFSFQFDDPELVHIRHAFRDNVIMGGAPFGGNAADAFDTQSLRDPITDNSGLRLELRRPEIRSFVQGEPVVIELKLATLDLRGKRVHARIHPNFGHVQLAIQDPSGSVRAYRPLLRECAESDLVVLDEHTPAIYASAYIGYGKDGFYFDQSGLYQLRAIYHSLDGSEVVSNLLAVRVRSPLDRDEATIGEAYLGHDQGTLFTVLGSDTDALRSGLDALQEVAERFVSHPLAVYAHLVCGINAGRTFKTVSRAKGLKVREPLVDQAVSHLQQVVEASTVAPDRRIDNITLDMAFRKLARAQARQEDQPGANATLSRAEDFFTQRVGVNPSVRQFIQARTAALRSELGLTEEGPGPLRR